MNMRISARKNTAFYVETVLLVLFVLLCTGVLVRVFAQAQRLGRSAEQLSQSVTLAQSAAETFASADGEQELELLLPQTDGVCTLYYDARGAAADHLQKNGYTVTITVQKTPQPAGMLSSADIMVWAAGRGDACYALKTARYWSEKGEGREVGA